VLDATPTECCTRRAPTASSRPADRRTAGRTADGAGGAQVGVPNSEPMPAVAAIASALQNVTRQAPVATFAPPACAATAPSSASEASEVPEIQ
jgi:hypothetical protein